jgi:hypothetical protein
MGKAKKYDLLFIISLHRGTEKRFLDLLHPRMHNNYNDLMSEEGFHYNTSGGDEISIPFHPVGAGYFVLQAGMFFSVISK